MINQKKNHLFSSVKNQNLKSLILMNQLFFLQIVLTNKKSSMMLKLLSIENHRVRPYLLTRRKNLERILQGVQDSPN